MYKVKGKEYPCLQSVTMGIIGGKWKTVILYHLLQGPLRYNELRKKMETVTERTLSLQLKQLEKNGIINKRIHKKKPPQKVSYGLSEFGKTVIPLLEAIGDWGQCIVENNS